MSGHRFRFLPNGDPPPKYRILNFRQPRPGHYEWVTVGTYDNKKLSVSTATWRGMAKWTEHSLPIHRAS